MTLKQTQNQKESEKQLLNRQANCFLRGLSEIYIEQKELKESEKKDFSILNTFFFQYHSPINFYVAKDNEYLHDKIDRGLEKILESGQLLCIYKHHYGEFIKRAKLKEDNRIFLGSGKPEKTEHPELYLDFTKDYTNIFKDIEEKQTSQLTPSKCNSLIENLEHENEQLYPNKLKK